MSDELEDHLLAQLGRSRIGFWHLIRARTVVSQVPLGATSIVLDIGAGSGDLGVTLERERPSARYRFYEPIASVADRLTDRFGVEARMDSIDSSDVGVIALLDVLEHIENPASFLRPLVARSGPGTKFVITVPALPVLWSSWDEQLGHHRRYTKRSLNQMVASLDIRIHEVSYIFPELLVPAVFRVVLRRMMRQGGSASAEFAEFGPRLDRLLLRCSAISYRARRIWPAGTSLLLIASRASADGSAMR